MTDEGKANEDKANEDKANRSDRRSRWNMIASLLGAVVPPEPEQPTADEAAPEPAPADTAPLPPPSQQKPKRPQRERQVSDWNALCGELGIAVPTPPEAPSETSAPAAWESVPSEPLSAWSAGDSHPERDVTPPCVDADAAPPDDVMDTAPAAAWALGVEMDVEMDEVEESAETEESERDSRRVAGRASEERGSRASRRRRRRRRPESAERDESPTDGPVSIAGGEPSDDLDAATTFDAGEAADADATDEAVRPDRGRRVRRRRRPAARRDVTSFEDDEADEPEAMTAPTGPVEDCEVDHDILDDDSDDAIRDDDIRDDDDSDDDIRGDDDSDDDSDDDKRESSREDRDRSGRDRPSRGRHKKIPTWEEAISVMVTTNMELRRREGNGRNRPRGSRRRGRDSSDRS